MQVDVFRLVAVERRRLAKALEELTAEQWAGSSLCGDWTAHEVAAHLNAPFEVGAVRFLRALASARGNFDLANERLGQQLARQLDPAACVAGLRAHAEHRFTPPGQGPEAPLTDVVVHGGDILRPLGRTVDTTDEALLVVLRFVANQRGRRGFAAVDVGDLHLEATDVDVSSGHGGTVVRGPALSLIGATLGRPDYLHDLDGPGAELLRARLAGLA